jgi:hypothetical protein
MKNLFLLISILISSIITAQDITELNQFARNTKTIIVSATEMWTSTEINLLPDDSVSIIVEGIASSNWGFEKRGLWAGPEGFGDSFGSAHPLGSVASMAVIAKIGDGGTPFYIGRTKTFKSNVGGLLYLGYNDNQFSDNFGYFIVFFTLINLDDITPRVVSVKEKNINLNNSFTLSQNYPNPFNPNTIIEYELPLSGNAEIDIYDINGKLVRKLGQGFLSKGFYKTIWDGKDNLSMGVASGTYIYQLKVNDNVQMKKMLLLK